MNTARKMSRDIQQQQQISIVFGGSLLLLLPLLSAYRHCSCFMKFLPSIRRFSFAVNLVCRYSPCPLQFVLD
jgi:hypothetical protein